MRASSITLLLATGLLAVAGCGSGGGDPSGAAAPFQNDTYQTPPSSYERPASTAAPDDYEQPPSIYERPGSTAGSSPPPGQQDSTCELFCGMAVDQDCESDPDSEDGFQALPLNECIAACEEDVSGMDCEPQYRRATSCIAGGHEFTCKELGDIQRGRTPPIPPPVLEDCATDIDPLVTCRQPDPPPGNGSCNLVSRCQGCTDECQRCRCENLGSDAGCPACRPEP